MFNVIKFVAFTIGGFALKSAWNWLTQDVTRKPGTKEFAVEYRKAYAKYKELRRLDDAYRKGKRDGD